MPEAIVTVIDGADHFFSTGLEALDAALADWVVALGRATPGASGSGSRFPPTG